MYLGQKVVPNCCHFENDQLVYDYNIYETITLSDFNP